LTEQVTVTSADALTIGSRVADAEQAIRLADANKKCERLEEENKAYRAEVTRFEIFASMGNTEAAGNITRINALIATNDEFRAEAKSSIADIEKARGQAATAGGIAEKLALGTDEAIQEVVDAAGPAL
jgi:hypothetical protein